MSKERSATCERPELERAETRRTRLLPENTTVVELGETVATATCGRLLRSLGASVTRILPKGTVSELEDAAPHLHTETGRESATALWLREGKELFDPDLSDPTEREQVEDSVARADVVLIAGDSESWSRQPLDIDALPKVAPQAVFGQITRWGDDGPSVRRRGSELTVQAAGGVMNIIGQLEREPVRLGGRPVQTTAGLLALDGVMIGLFRRQRTGQGAFFTTSEFESAAHLEWKIASAVQSGRRRELRGEDGGGPVVVRTRDGYFGLFYNPRNWEDVKAVIGDPRLDEPRFADDRARGENQAELAAVIEETTEHMSKVDLYHAVQARGIPAGHVATMTDLLADPQYGERNFFETIVIDGGTKGRLPGAPWQVLDSTERETGKDER